MPSAVFFDFDGTLLDTESTVLTAWREEYRRHGLELAEDGSLATIGTDCESARRAKPHPDPYLAAPGDRSPAIGGYDWRARTGAPWRRLG